MTSRRRLAALSILVTLAACGGGGGGGGSASPTPAPAPSGSDSATLTVSLAGGASPGIDHLWVTITGVAMHADATRVYGDGDPGWVTVTLPAPVTVDLASSALSHGQVVQLLSQAVGNLGTYQQLRLLLAPPAGGTALLPSASAQGLTWNDQVQYTDAAGAHTVALEVPNLGSGLRMQTGFTLSASTATPVAIEWNAHDSLVRRASAGGADRFTLRDDLQLYNEQLATAVQNLIQQGTLFNAITGQLDTHQFCTGTAQAGCIHDVVASATALSADGRFHESVRSVNVGSDGSFLIYPLPGTTIYDVVIHGVNMRTLIVRNVFVDPTGLLQLAPTMLSTATNPIVPVLDTTGRSVTLSQALTPAAGRVLFGVTIPGSGAGTAAGDLPYAIDGAATDPASGQLVRAVWLPGGPVLDAKIDPQTFQQGTPPTFQAVTPSEGLNAWSVWSEGRESDSASATTVLAAGSATVVPPTPPALSGFATGTIAVTLAGAPGNAPDHAELVVANDLGTVSVTDVSSLLATQGGSVQVAVPSGQNASATSASAAVYRVALRTWQAAAESATARWSYAPGLVRLDTTSSATASVGFP